VVCLLLPSLRAGMILLPTGPLGAGLLAAQIAPARAKFLIRVRAGRGAAKLPVVRRLHDGYGVSRFGGVPVRVIDAEIAIASSAGRAAGRYRLITTRAEPPWPTSCPRDASGPAPAGRAGHIHVQRAARPTAPPTRPPSTSPYSLPLDRGHRAVTYRPCG
jgi:hypothetical protein